MICLAWENSLYQPKIKKADNYSDAN
jgi:phage antirepressor YoqD-like protein